MTRPRLLLGLLAAAALGLAGWYLADRFGPTAEPPPVPADLADPGAEAAVRAAREAVLAAPRSAAAWGRLGMVFSALLYDQPADACFAEAGRRDPADPRWPYLQGHLRALLDPAAAGPHLRRAAVAAGGTPEARAVARVRLAEYLFERGDRPAAEEQFRRCLAERPDDPRASLGLGLARLAADDPAGAEPLLRAAARGDATRKQAVGQLARAALLRGDPAAAADWERRAAALPPDAPAGDPILAEVRAAAAGRKAVRTRAAALAAGGQTDAAVRLLADAARDDPDPATLGLLGEIQFRAGRPADAEASLRAALARQPDRADSRYYLGAALAARATRSQPDLLREALGHLDFAAAARPDSATAHLFRGQVLWALGRPADALAALETGLGADPKNPDLHVTLLLYLDQAGRTDEARRRLPAAEAVVPAADAQFQAIRAKLRGTAG